MYRVHPEQEQSERLNDPGRRSASAVHAACECRAGCVPGRGAREVIATRGTSASIRRKIYLASQRSAARERRLGTSRGQNAGWAPSEKRPLTGRIGTRPGQA